MNDVNLDPADQALRDHIAELEQKIVELTLDKSSLSTAASVARQHAESLQAAAVVAADESDIGRAIQVVLSELHKVVPYDSASVQQLREGRLVIVGGVGFADLDVILGESFAVDNADSPNGEVVHRKRPFIVADTEQYRAFRRGLHVGNGIRSWLGVPLLHRDKLLGIVALDKAEPDFYSEEHQRIAVAFVSMIGAAMAKA